MAVTVTLADGTVARVDMIGPELGELVEMWTADRTLWHVDDKSRVVDDGDPEAAHLYVAEGHMVPKSEAEALGAFGKKHPPKAKQEEPPEVTEEESPEPKQAKHPANKQAAKSEDK